jgi:hypothetical protein
MNRSADAPHPRDRTHQRRKPNALAARSAPSKPEPARRRLLGAIAAVYAMPHTRWALAQTGAQADRSAFMQLSTVLTGRDRLDAKLAQRLYDALAAEDRAFGARTTALLAFMKERRLDPARLQPVLDEERRDLASLPRAVVAAWYLGVVGSGERERCVAYEEALGAVTVADVLKPPTYCYGTYASWSRKPT